MKQFRNIPLKITFENMDKNISMYSYFICWSFHFDFKNVIKYTTLLSIFTLFMETIFPGSNTRPTQDGDVDDRSHDPP